ncbi:peptide ABC transporter substrate-binding protein [bacterium]|nr:peptide ABC transporter substrate-binding protein [bacterium]
MKEIFMNAKMKLIPALILTLFLGACTGQDSKTSNKILRIGVSQEFEILHPIISQMALSSYIYRMTNHSLTTINADWEAECFLCDELPTLENGKAKKLANGKLEIQWAIREDAKWGDGTLITGHDVEFSWMLGNHPNISVGERDVYHRIEKITIDKENPKKFTFLLREARYDYNQQHTFYIVPKHIEEPVFEKSKDTAGLYEKQTVYNADPANPGLYSGPYRVSEIKLGSHITLVRNENYWKKAPIEQIIYKLIPNTQALEANLLAGSVDMICEGSGISFDQAIALEERIEKDSKLGKRIKVEFREGTIYEHITFNLKDPIVADVRVRRALAYGADREKMVTALFKGRQSVALHNTHPLDPYYTDDVTKYEYSPEKANQILDEAGWKMGDNGIRSKEGKPLQLTLMTTAQNLTREQVQVYFQSEWKKIGVDLILKTEPPRVFFGETVRKGEFPNLAMFAWVSSPDNPPRSTLFSGEIPTKANGWAGQNSGSFVNKEFDKHIEAIPTEFDFEKRKEHMKRISQIYTEELPAIPLYLRAAFAIVPANLKGFRITGHQFYSSQSVADWSLE